MKYHPFKKGYWKSFCVECKNVAVKFRPGVAHIAVGCVLIFNLTPKSSCSSVPAPGADAPQWLLPALPARRLSTARERSGHGRLAEGASETSHTSNKPTIARQAFVVLMRTS